jgi:hypothetical protein
MADHAANEWEWGAEIFKTSPGQFITSLESIASVCAKDVSVQSVRTALLKLSKWGFLTNKSTKTGRLITIVKWDSYQLDSDSPNSQSSRRLTNSQQSSNKELTTNKNVKNVKNVKKDKKDIPPEVAACAVALLNAIRMTKADAKDPDLDSWGRDMDRMVRLDKREPSVVMAVIEQLPRLHFWSGVVLSPSALRKNFDRIEIEARRVVAGGNHGRNETRQEASIRRSQQVLDAFQDRE